MIVHALDLGEKGKTEKMKQEEKELEQLKKDGKLSPAALAFLLSDVRRMLDALHARLYGNTEILGFGLRDYARPAFPSSIQYTPRVNLNVIASATDALHAKITKSKPRPSFQTDGGTWKMQQKARRLDKWMRGVFYETKIYRKGSDAFRECEVFGTAAIKLVPTKKKRIQFERVFIDEILVDDADGIYGEPRQMCQRMKMHRAAIYRTYGDTEEKRLAIADKKNTATMLAEATREYDKSQNDIITKHRGFLVEMAKIETLSVPGIEIAEIKTETFARSQTAHDRPPSDAWASADPRRRRPRPRRAPCR